MDYMPVFVRIEQPQDTEELLSALRSKISEIKLTLEKIGLLSEQETAKVQEWKSNFELVNNKIDSINKNLLEPERL